MSQNSDITYKKVNVPKRQVDFSILIETRLEATFISLFVRAYTNNSTNRPFHSRSVLLSILAVEIRKNHVNGL